MLKQLLILFFLSTFFLSCIGTKKIDKWVAKQYGSAIVEKPKAQNDFLYIISSISNNDNKLSTTTKQIKNMLPLIFYWQWDYINTCKFNSQIPFNNFTSTVLQYANSKGLKAKLNGQKIELSLDKTPSQFTLLDRGHEIWLVYAYGWDNISFRPDKEQMVVTYKILNAGAVTKSGTIAIANEEKITNLKFLQSIKKATYQYFDDYDENIKTLSKKVIDKLITEL